MLGGSQWELRCPAPERTPLKGRLYGQGTERTSLAGLLGLGGEQKTPTATEKLHLGKKNQKNPYSYTQFLSSLCLRKVCLRFAKNVRDKVLDGNHHQCWFGGTGETEIQISLPEGVCGKFQEKI